MKYTIEEIIHAARVLREACGGYSDCRRCPLEQEDYRGRRKCILDSEWPENWDVGLLENAKSGLRRNTRGGRR